MSPNEHDRSSGWVTYVVLAFALSWAIWTPAVLATRGVIDPPLPMDAFTPISIFVGAFGPLVAALVLSGRARGGEGRTALLRRGLQWRTIGWRSLAVIVGLPFVVNGAARALDSATGGDSPPFSAESAVVLVAVFFAILLLGGPIQEEFGWRGYALPRLVDRYGIPAGTLVLGTIWAAWHLPFWFMDGSGMEGTPMPVYLVYVLGLTAVMTWLHNRTAGSVLAAILMHTTANWISNVLPTHGPEATDSNAYLFQAVAYLLVGALLVGISARSPDAALRRTDGQRVSGP
jgi:uncharacterized protein